MFDQKFPDQPDQGHNKKKGTEWAAPQRAALSAKPGQVARQFCGHAHERDGIFVLGEHLPVVHISASALRTGSHFVTPEPVTGQPCCEPHKPEPISSARRSGAHKQGLSATGGTVVLYRRPAPSRRAGGELHPSCCCFSRPRTSTREGASARKGAQGQGPGSKSCSSTLHKSHCTGATVLRYSLPARL